MKRSMRRSAIPGRRADQRADCGRRRGSFLPRRWKRPGGLKVQTIHAFCTRLLQQFPFEANVPAHFSVLEETQQQQLLEQIRRDVLLKAANAPDSAIGRALTAIIPLCSDFVFQNALSEAIRKRGAIMQWLDAAGGIDSAMAQLSRRARHRAGRHAGGGRGRDHRRSASAVAATGHRRPRFAPPVLQNDKDKRSRLRAAAAAARQHAASRPISTIFFTGRQ